MVINCEMFKKIGLVIGILAGVSIIINIFIFKDFSNMVNSLGIFSCYIGVSNYFKKGK